MLLSRTAISPTTAWWSTLPRTLLLVLAPLVSSVAAAQVVPRHTMELEVGSPAQQVAVDGTSMDNGYGAVFVPSRSRPELEPQVRVYLGDSVVARGPTGRRLPLPAGQYRVAIGQGPQGWRPATTAVVYPSETTIADGFFGSLRVTAVDPAGRSVAVPYTIVSADGYRIYGPTDTTDDDEYASTRTWILTPGSYRIVPSNGPTGRIGTVSTVISRDQRARVRLLVDGEGEVVGSEPGDFEPTLRDAAWRFRWTVGGSGALGQSHGQLNGFSGDSMRVDLFSDMGVTYDRLPHLLRFALTVEQGWVGFTRPLGQDLPLQKLDDLLRFESEYTFRLTRVLGPYVRATLRTALLPRTVTADRDYAIITTGLSGREHASSLDRGDSLTLLNAFSPLTTQEGAGMSFTPWESRAFRVGLSVGVAARQSLYRGEGRYLVSAGGGTARLLALDDSFEWGPEAGAWFRWRLGRWVVLRVRAEAFVSIDAALSGDFGVRPVFQLVGSAGVRLTDWASIVYSATLHRDELAIEDMQFRHALNLQLQYSLF